MARDQQAVYFGCFASLMDPLTWGTLDQPITPPVSSRLLSRGFEKPFEMTSKQHHLVGNIIPSGFKAYSDSLKTRGGDVPGCIRTSSFPFNRDSVPVGMLFYGPTSRP